jgi:hypothetical protein
LKKTQEIVNKKGSFADKVNVSNKLANCGLYGHTKVFKPKYEKKEVDMPAVTSIGNILYVPTHEIIDELSEEDESEKKIICFHQKNIVIIYPNARIIEYQYPNEE